MSSPVLSSASSASTSSAPVTSRKGPSPRLSVQSSASSDPTQILVTRTGKNFTLHMTEILQFLGELMKESPENSDLRSFFGKINTLAPQTQSQLTTTFETFFKLFRSTTPPSVTPRESKVGSQSFVNLMQYFPVSNGDSTPSTPLPNPPPRTNSTVLLSQIVGGIPTTPNRGTIGEGSNSSSTASTTPIRAFFASISDTRLASSVAGITPTFAGISETTPASSSTGTTPTFGNTSETTPAYSNTISSSAQSAQASSIATSEQSSKAL